MIETYPYFWVEVDVERAAEGGVHWFMTFAFDEEDGERYPYTGIEREDGMLVFSDTQTSERFDPSTGVAQEYVRYLDAGTTTYAGQTAWATHKYDSFLRTFARAQIRNLLDELRAQTAADWDSEQWEKARAELTAFAPSLERLRKETGDAFEHSDKEPFTFIWHLLAAMRGEEGAAEALSIARERVYEAWNWAQYEGFFEGLVGSST